MAKVQNKPVMLVGIDDSDLSFYSLEWALEKFFAPYSPNYPFKLTLIHAKQFMNTAFKVVAASTAKDILYTGAKEEHQNKMAARILEKANELCVSKGVKDIEVEIVEGDARNVLCDAVDQHHASLLVVGIGSHGYGTIKRAVLGSVSDYCAHNAKCSVMIVKKPKTNN